ncbi:MAG: hypothetical protein DRJ42_20690 [Deltaproteobacteria bacterium]|nr:MAG: hypothetical protein DRJ42_20690 [Deltaproteobacteria bacterium]
MGDKKGMIVGGCGLILAGLCFLSFAFWSFMVVQDSGAISAQEATPGVMASCCCLFISLLIMGGGIFMAVQAKKKASAGPPPAV